MTRPTSIRLDDETAERLDRLARAVDRPRTWLIEQAISRYLEDEAWQVEAIRDALGEYRSGSANLVSHDDVMARVAAKVQSRQHASSVD